MALGRTEGGSDPKKMGTGQIWPLPPDTSGSQGGALIHVPACGYDGFPQEVNVRLLPSDLIGAGKRLSGQSEATTA